MRYFMGLVVAVFVMALPEKASACQPSYQHLMKIDKYFQYDDQIRKNIYYKDDLFAAVVYAKKKGAKPIENDERIRTKREFDSLDKMRLKSVRNIIGKPPKSIFAPRMTEKEIARENEYMSKPKEMFDYWDGLQLSYASSDWYGMKSMCDPIGDLTLKNKQYYLIIGFGDKVSFTEPVSGPNDPLVDLVEGLVYDDERNPLRISPKNFFGEMHGFISVAVNNCPELEYSLSQYGMMWMDPELPSADILFHIKDEYGSEAEIKTQNFFERKTCEVGEQYLIIERPYNYYKREKGSALDMPKHRFLKITNGKINVDDISTNYQFTGEGIIPVEQVKTWIKEGAAR